MIVLGGGGWHLPASGQCMLRKLLGYSSTFDGGERGPGGPGDLWQLDAPWQGTDKHRTAKKMRHPLSCLRKTDCATFARCRFADGQQHRTVMQKPLTNHSPPTASPPSKVSRSCPALLAQLSEEDKRATTNVQNGLVNFFLFSFILYYYL